MFLKLFDSYSATYDPIYITFCILVHDVMSHMCTNFCEVLSFIQDLEASGCIFSRPFCKWPCYCKTNGKVQLFFVEHCAWKPKSNGLGVMSSLVLLVAVAPPMSQWGSYSDKFSSIWGPAIWLSFKSLGLLGCTMHFRRFFSPSNYNRFSALRAWKLNVKHLKIKC